MKRLSVVMPAFNEEKNILLSFKKLSDILDSAQINYELVYVDDGSRDHTWSMIEQLSSERERVKGVKLSRNFGKEAAIHAGLKCADGDCVVVMDVDMQHDPYVIVEMYALWQEGYDIVEGIKQKRGNENIVYKMMSVLFYKLLSGVMGLKMNNSSDYKLLDKRVVHEIVKLPESHRFFRALTYWVGFKRATIQYKIQERVEGSSKWSIKRLTTYAINNITSFSSVPLQIITWIGVLYLVFAFILGIDVLYDYVTNNSLEGFTTVILLLLIIGSTMSIALGIIGIYIGKIYDEIKGRPSYIIEDVIEKKLVEKPKPQLNTSSIE